MPTDQKSVRKFKQYITLTPFKGFAPLELDKLHVELEDEIIREKKAVIDKHLQEEKRMWEIDNLRYQ